YAIAVTAGNQALIANLAAINVDSENVGFILSLQEFKKIEELEEQVRKERYSKGHVASQTFDQICSASPAMNAVKETAIKYARYDLPVLLMGDVGVGKRALAECIHNASLRKRSPFVAVDCGGLSAQMQQTQFMGAADGRTKGAFEIAHTGTLLIEHVAMLDEYCQYQLLHVLKHGCLVGLDSRMMLPVDIRVICTTGRDLYQRMRDGHFLEPLYCMLTQLELLVPSLRERAEDLPQLLDQSLEKYSTLYRKYVHLSSDARELIYAQHWGGNVLQLQLFCEKLLLLADDKLITADFVSRHLPRSFAAAENRVAPAPMVVHSTEEAQLIETLEKYGGSRALTAEALGVSKTTLWRRMKKFGIAEKYR
ncbi:MAG: sigma 54-interacting transcriptional regulator, partial [Clostridia bacterium]|nr:sigma 54-interacting transcriptional regulator [Clostridia bacterium]